LVRLKGTTAAATGQGNLYFNSFWCD